MSNKSWSDCVNEYYDDHPEKRRLGKYMPHPKPKKDYHEIAKIYRSYQNFSSIGDDFWIYCCIEHYRLQGRNYESLTTYDDRFHIEIIYKNPETKKIYDQEKKEENKNNLDTNFLENKSTLKNFANDVKDVIKTFDELKEENDKLKEENKKSNAFNSSDVYIEIIDDLKEENKNLTIKCYELDRNLSETNKKLDNITFIKNAQYERHIIYTDELLEKLTCRDEILKKIKKQLNLLL